MNFSRPDVYRGIHLTEQNAMSGFSCNRRATLAGTVLLVLLTFWGCGRINPSGFSGDVDLLLTRGDAYVASLALRPAEGLHDEEIIALGYVERARLGLGSPFRLIEYLLRDPDLSEATREPLAYGLLARTLEGRAYAVDPEILDIVRLTASPSHGVAGREQLRLIERAISNAPTPAAGERTVRIGYQLAASERTVADGYASVIAHVAALVSDRRRAREDAVLLLRAAARQGVDPLVLLPAWRREMRFRVEQPAIQTARDEEVQAREGPSFALSLRALALRQNAPLSLVAPVQPEVSGERESVLSAEAAERLRLLAQERNYPAQAPVRIAVEINREGLLSRSGMPEAVRQARLRFADEVENEEKLAAGAALLHSVDRNPGPRSALVLLQSATFLRGWNQEEPWFPGDPAPSRRELEGRYGLAAIEFDDDVAQEWRPYYLRHLARGIVDIKRVVPTISLRGLTIRFGELPNQAEALALHEPWSRTLYLPPATGAGTLAHELAHDLDWQLARRRYAARGGYGTDMAIRNNRHDRIAAAMMELSSSLANPSLATPASAHATRPAEVFARGADWLIAAALAREGRLGGYLTSFQDAGLTGYGTTRGPDISGAAVPALLSIFDGIAPITDETRQWALETYGPRRSLTAMELVQVVSDAGLGLPAEERLQKIARAGRQSFEAVAECSYGSAQEGRRLMDAQRKLAEASLEAAARGAAIDAIRALAAHDSGPDHASQVDAWIAWRLYGAPEPIDPLLEELAPAFEDLLLQGDLIDHQGRAPLARTAFEVDRVPSLCGGNPFAAESPVGRFRATGAAR